MSWQAVKWVLENSRSRGAARLVAVSIASHANPNGRNSYPSAETIAREAGIRRAYVFPCLQLLENLGELVRDSGGGRRRSNQYILRMTVPQPQSTEPQKQSEMLTECSAETIRSKSRNSQRSGTGKTKNRTEKRPALICSIVDLRDRCHVQEQSRADPLSPIEEHITNTNHALSYEVGHCRSGRILRDFTRAIFRNGVSNAYFDGTQQRRGEELAVRCAVDEAALGLVSNRAVCLRDIDLRMIRLETFRRLKPRIERFSMIKDYAERARIVVDAVIGTVANVAVELLPKGTLATNGQT